MLQHVIKPQSSGSARAPPRAVRLWLLRAARGRTEQLTGVAHTPRATPARVLESQPPRNGRRHLEGSAFLTALRRELWVLKQLDWNMRILTPFEPLSLLSVILDLADGEVPGEPSIVKCAGTFVAVSVTQHRGQVSPEPRFGVGALYSPLDRLGQTALVFGLLSLRPYYAGGAARPLSASSSSRAVICAVNLFCAPCFAIPR